MRCACTPDETRISISSIKEMKMVGFVLLQGAISEHKVAPLCPRLGDCKRKRELSVIQYENQEVKRSFGEIYL